MTQDCDASRMVIVLVELGTAMLRESLDGEKVGHALAMKWIEAATHALSFAGSECTCGAHECVCNGGEDDR